jgi:hypothetical protein
MASYVINLWLLIKIHIGIGSWFIDVDTTAYDPCVQSIFRQSVSSLFTAGVCSLIVHRLNYCVHYINILIFKYLLL